MNGFPRKWYLRCTKNTFPWHGTVDDAYHVITAVRTKCRWTGYRQADTHQQAAKLPCPWCGAPVELGRQP